MNRVFHKPCQQGRADKVVRDGARLKGSGGKNMEKNRLLNPCQMLAKSINILSQ